MGFLWNGQCYQDGSSALQAFRASLTNGDSTGITTFTVAPTINGTTGVVNWTISHRSLPSNALVTRSGTTQLGSCNQSFFNADEAIALIPFIGLFIALAVGYMSGQQR